QTLQGQAAQTFTTTALDYCRQLYTADRSREALPLARLSIELADRCGDSLLQIRAAAACGNLLGDAGELALAMQQHVRALQLAKATENRRYLALSLMNIGTLYHLAALPQAGIEVYRKVVGSELASADLAVTCDTAASLAQCHLEMGELGLGLAVIQIAFDPQAVTLSPLNAILAYRTYVRLLAMSGRLEAAGRAMTAMQDLAARHPSPRVTRITLLVQGSYDMACGRVEAGQQRLLEALDLARDSQCDVPDVLLALAQGLTQAGRVAEAEPYLLQLAEWARHDLPPPTAPISVSPQERSMLEKLANGYSIKKLAEELGIDHDNLRATLSRLYKRLGARNSAEAYTKLRAADQANFAQTAVTQGLAEALGARSIYLQGLIKTLASHPQASICKLADSRRVQIEQLIIAFNTFQRRGDQHSARQLAEAIERRITLSQAVVQAGAAVATLTYDI
ncbi:MAG: response regulator transcription factor, partial [Betaproteobacteria bacterium]|nr:response regulator transcription factor [Betaproteobacteria bacterium]